MTDTLDRPARGVRRLSAAIVAAALLLVLTACSTALPEPAPVIIPRAPTAVTATAGDGEATVTWTAPTLQYNSPALTEYTVTSSDGQTATVPGTSTEATVTGLTNGTAYTFTVTATNADGTSPESEPSNEVTPSP